MKGLLSFDEVHEITGYCPAHIKRLETDPKYMKSDPFPARIVYGHRVFWDEQEVLAWHERRKRRDVKLPPVKRKKDMFPPLPRNKSS